MAVALGRWLFLVLNRVRGRAGGGREGGRVSHQNNPDLAAGILMKTCCLNVRVIMQQMQVAWHGELLRGLAYRVWDQQEGRRTVLNFRLQGLKWKKLPCRPEMEEVG